MIQYYWLSMLRQPMKLLWGTLLFIILNMLFSYLIPQVDYNVDLFYTLINLTGLIVAPTMQDTNCSMSQLLQREQKLFRYSLSSVFIHSITLFSGVMIFSIIHLKMLWLTPILPVTAIFLTIKILNLMTADLKFNQSLCIIVAFPLILPILIFTLMMPTQITVAACFLLGWILVHIAILMLLCLPRSKSIINLS